MRYLQSTYWLEPAGSHGVWGLDDYQFLPFLWGSGQLKSRCTARSTLMTGHNHLKPKAIHDPEVLEAFSKDYMYLSCISFINSIKTASLRWHSPMLDDISAVKTWDKVNSGMRKMYAAEVLGKLPVMQHALFGSLLPFPTPEEDPEIAKALDEGPAQVDEHGHVHPKGEKGWAMDCCGIPVPSAFAQAQVDHAGPKTASFISRPGIKPIPFD
jgi:serine/threonine-protein phosphatase 2A activator